jgi:hypothetical protein
LSGGRKNTDGVTADVERLPDLFAFLTAYVFRQFGNRDRNLNGKRARHYFAMFGKPKKIAFYGAGHALTSKTGATCFYRGTAQGTDASQSLGCRDSPITVRLRRVPPEKDRRGPCQTAVPSRCNPMEVVVREILACGFVKHSPT